MITSAEWTHRVVEWPFHALVTIRDKHHDCTLCPWKLYLRPTAESWTRVGTWVEKEMLIQGQESAWDSRKRRDDMEE